MKKLLNIAAAVLASTMLFVGCSNGLAAPAEPEYQDFAVDLEEKVVNIGWYPNVFEMIGSEFKCFDGAKDPKITVTWELADSNWFQVRLQYGNGSVGDWGALDTPIYDEKGKKITLDGGFIKSNSKCDNLTAVIKPNEKQVKTFLDRGLIIDGSNIKLTSVTLSYVGEEVVQTNVTNFAKGNGKVGGEVGKLQLDPENANLTVWAIEGIKADKSVKSEYKYDNKLNLQIGKKDPTKLKVTLRNGYKYVFKEGEIVKEDTFDNGAYASKYVQFDNMYNYLIADKQYIIPKTDHDGGKDKGGWTSEAFTIEKGEVFNPYWIFNGPVKIKDMVTSTAKYEEDKAYAERDLDAGIQYTNEITVGLSEKTEKIKLSGYKLKNAYVYEDSDCTKKAQQEEVHIDNTEMYVVVYTSAAKASKYVIPETEFTGTAEYKEFEIKLADGVACGEAEKDAKGNVTKYAKCDFKEITKVEIVTNESAGDIYVKSLVWD